MKVALALFVKNEVQDIGSWIGWHFAQGVDKLFIFDDHSTDGTYEVIQAASTIRDIELTRTDPVATPDFYWRQANSFMEACRRSVGVFDWIGFLDGDEYLSLDEAPAIGDFLAKFDGFNAVGLNWRIYGSGHRVLKTKIPAYDAFRFHATKDLDDQRLIKSFIRPETCSSEYINPHRFSVEGMNYADACGQPITWVAEACKTIDWTHAAINHYFSRTMEHYVERIRKRAGADLADSTGYWDHFNRNDIYREERPETIAKANAIAQQIKEACVRTYAASLSGFPAIPFGRGPAGKVFGLRTHTGHGIALNQHNRFMHQHPEDDASPKISGIIYNDDPGHIYLVAENGHAVDNIPFYIKNDERYLCAYKFIIEKAGDSGGIHLKSPVTGKYLCFIPLDHGAAIECNRDAASDWETLFLSEKTSSGVTLSNCPLHMETKQKFIDFVRLHGSTLSYNDLLLALCSLPRAARTDVIEDKENTIISWL